MSNTTAPHPLPLTDWPWSSRAAVRGVLTDIDDTLTRDGAIEPEALAALYRLHAAGLPIIAITGRPSGWSEGFAMDWPVTAIVAENGSIRLSNEGNALQKHHYQSAYTRAHEHARLQQVLHTIEQQVPGAVRAADSAGRETDIAIDHSELAHLPPEVIAQVVHLMREAGLTATVSSIHINGWLGTHNKWTGAQWAVKACLGRELAHEADQWVYVGDSTNDQLLFEHLPLTVGVANLLRFSDQLTHWPRYITPGERGVGFAQVVDALLAPHP
jgi:hypothetical protein